ncbi:MAG: hypothetical protein AB2A00_39775 [Myxococcota bacterium]
MTDNNLQFLPKRVTFTDTRTAERYNTVVWRARLIFFCILVLVAPGVRAQSVPEDAPAASREDLPGKTAPDYLLGAFRLSPPRWQLEVREVVAGAWLLGAVHSAVGGHIWAPLLAYRHVPANAPRRAAIMLGALGTASPWVVTGVMTGAALVMSALFAAYTNPHVLSSSWLRQLGKPAALQSALLPPLTAALLSFAVQVVYVVFPVAASVELAVNWYLVPRAISDAYSDAYVAKHREGY